ncbi:MAG: class I SAM-dependent methyltransferase, partial [Clostridiales bacterium]|nr:class I SAM-dependent methyltransferase [Clostridiales bacterium]
MRSRGRGERTGKFAELLLERGARVFAVEPNGYMLADAEKCLSEYTLFAAVRGSAENTSLSAASVDFVTAAQAFHWFDAAAFRKECLRILKPGGKVALVWNAFDSSDETCRAYGEFLAARCSLFKGFGGGYADNTDAITLFFGGTYETVKIPGVQKYDKRHFIDRALSSSYTPRPSDDGFKAFSDDLSQFFDANERRGVIRFTCSTAVY